MSEWRNGGVLVGTDGSEASLKAVEWAAHAAAQSDRELTLCCVLPGREHTPQSDVSSMSEELRVRGKRIVSAAASWALRSEPTVMIREMVRLGHPAGELRDMAEHEGQALLVVGSHGADWFHRILIGSVSTQVVRHAPCTVVVTRGVSADPNGPVVVGVDGSACTEAAVGFAFETAARRGADLVAVHTFTTPTPIYPGMPSSSELDATTRHPAESLLRKVVGPFEERFPGVRVRHDVISGPAARVLVDASRTASLVVVGSRGRGGFSGLLLGSVSQHVVALADCPVAIAR